MKENFECNDFSKHTSSKTSMLFVTSVTFEIVTDGQIKPLWIDWNSNEEFPLS